MSKMPAKKKSCFQITSVTQAQVAASSVADDTESLDDPDESRTEDVSSEVFEASRVEYETVVDRISLEETHNNIGGVEAPGVAASYTPQVGLLPAGPTNEGFRKTGVMGSNQTSQQAMVTSSSTSPLISLSGVVQQQPIPPASGGTTNTSIGTSQPVVSSSTPSTTNSTASCSSRFRVIKLDHGTGEPFKRGRWTCMEFFEKDSEGSAASRSVDSTRHANIPDPSTDRDIGLGVTGGSMVAPATHSGQGLGSMADASASTSHAHSAETLQQQQLHHPNYSVGQQAGSGAVTQSTFSNKSMTAPAMQPSVGHVTSAASQNFVPIGHSSQSPSITSAGQTQTLAYPPQQQPMLQQIPLGHHLSNQSSGLPQNQADYYQQHQAAPMQPVALAGQTLPIASHSVGQSLGQGPSPVGTSADGGAAVLGQGGELLTAGGSSVPVSQPASTQMQHSGRGLGGTGGSLLGMVPTLPQQSVGPYASSGQPLNLYPAPPGVQNVPAVTVSTSVPPLMLSASSAASTMPNPPPSVLPPGQQIPPNGAGTPGNTGGAQGLLSVGNGQVEGSPGTVEDLASQPPTLSGKDPLKPLMPENLQLTSPSVNSLFGITIPVDEDDDRNPSMAFYQAFQSGHRLQDSKAHIDSASGASVVAIDNKIEQAMDLVKSHLMYAVREEVEVLKEQIKELFERNSLLERENAVLKSLANNDQLSQLSVPAATNSMGALPQQGAGQLNVSAPLQSQPQVQHQAQAQPQQNQVQPQQHQAQAQPQQNQVQPQQHQAQPQQHQTQPQQLYAQPQSQQHQAQPQQQQLHAQPQFQQPQAQAQQHQAQPQQHQANLEASQHPQQTQPNVTSA